MAKTHYNPDALRERIATSRVAEYCGAITWHGNPQAFVVETFDKEQVDCKNCLKRLHWDY